MKRWKNEIRKYLPRIVPGVWNDDCLAHPMWEERLFGWKRVWVDCTIYRKIYLNVQCVPLCVCSHTNVHFHLREVSSILMIPATFDTENMFGSNIKIIICGNLTNLNHFIVDAKRKYLLTFTISSDSSGKFRKLILKSNIKFEIAMVE